MLLNVRHGQHRSDDSPAYAVLHPSLTQQQQLFRHSSVSTRFSISSASISQSSTGNDRLRPLQVAHLVILYLLFFHDVYFLFILHIDDSRTTDDAAPPLPDDRTRRPGTPTMRTRTTTGRHLDGESLQVAHLVILYLFIF